MISHFLYQKALIASGVSHAHIQVHNPPASIPLSGAGHHLLNPQLQELDLFAIYTYFIYRYSFIHKSQIFLYFHYGFSRSSLPGFSFKLCILFLSRSSWVPFHEGLLNLKFFILGFQFCSTLFDQFLHDRYSLVLLLCAVWYHVMRENIFVLNIDSSTVTQHP